MTAKNGAKIGKIQQCLGQRNLVLDKVCGRKSYHVVNALLCQYFGVSESPAYVETLEELRQGYAKVARLVKRNRVASITLSCDISWATM